MAGERLAKITIVASLSPNDDVRANQTTQLQLRLAGAWRKYYRGAYQQQRQFIVPDPDDVGRDYVKQAVDNLLALIKLDVQSASLPYTVSVSRDLGNDLGTGWPRIAFDLEATQYDTQLNLDFYNPYQSPPTGWAILQQLPTLQPLRLQAGITPAGVFGTATGSLAVQVFEGNSYPLTYVWADDATATGPTRDKLRAGTYELTVRDADGVSVTGSYVITSDPQLLVTVQQTDTSLTLQVSGGVAPYAVAWDDGPTTLSRQGLAAGTYAATVTDAHGAQVRVEATLLANRCYFSQNPVRLELDAGDAYRADPTTKPGLSFVAQVWVEKVYNSGTYEQAGPDLEQPADLQGRTVFEVQSLLDAYVSEHLPPPSGYLVAKAQGLFTRFYLKWAEKFGTPPVRAALSTAQVHYVLCGGLSPVEAAAGNWPGYQAQVQPFLTWEPDYQRLLPQQPAYLYYQHVAATEVVQVWVQARQTDGTSGAAQLVASITPAQRWEVFYLDVSPARLGLTGSEVAGYQVWVKSSDGLARSQVRHFELERAYYPQARFLLYSNSLGGANVLSALGTGKLVLEVKASEAPRPSYDAQLGDVVTLARVGTPTLSVATGPRRRGQVLADQELLLSRRVALLRGGQYWPGRVTAATFVVKDEEQGLADLRFDFVLAQQARFTPRLPAAVVGQVTAAVAGGEGPQP